MSIRSLLTLLTFVFAFFGLMSMVGNVHVAEFYGILGISLFAAMYAWFKLGRFSFVKRKITKSDFKSN